MRLATRGQRETERGVEIVGDTWLAGQLRRQAREVLVEAKTQGVDMRKEQGDLHKEVEELRKQNEQLRAEKDEAGQALAKVLETVQATNQIAQKLGVTKSPFARRAEAPAAAPNPTPHE